MATGNFFGGQFFGGGFFGAISGASTPPPFPIGGGIPHSGKPRTHKDIIADRERFGIPDEERLKAERIVREVAIRQANALERDSQKRFEELARELELQGIGWDTRYLDALNEERSILIDAEIKRHFEIEREALSARNRQALISLATAASELELAEQEALDSLIFANSAQMAPAFLALAQIVGILHEAFNAKLQEDAEAPAKAKNAIHASMKEQARAINEEAEMLQTRLLETVLDSAKVILARHLEVTLH